MTDAADANIEQAELPPEPFTEETPFYEVLERTFIAPWIIEPGSTIRFKGSPGAHLRPLNASAAAAMERWYNLVVDVPDPFDPRKTITATPNIHHKTPHVDQTAADASEFELVSEPQPSTVVLPSLTEARASMSAGAPINTSQRPPPGVRPRDYLDQMEVVSAASAPPKKVLVR